MGKIFLFCFYFLPLLLSAQKEVTGRVLSEEGVPVLGVNIICLTDGKGISTDSSGDFRIQIVVPCRLKFSHINYREIIRDISDYSKLKITLQMLPHQLNEVAVSSRDRSGVTYTSQKQLERIPTILGEKDILKYMATMPGVATTNALDPGIYVRGGNSTENAFLVNDVEIANPNHLSGILSTFDPYVLNRSAIYKSGFPVKYNSYLSSYINMFPEPGDKEKYSGEMTLGLLSSAVRAQGPLVRGKTSFTASLRASYLQHIAQLYDKVNGGSAMPSYSFYDATAHVDSRISESLTASFFGLFTTDQLNIHINDATRHCLDWQTFSGMARLSYLKNDNALTFKVGYNSNNSEGNTGGKISVNGANKRQVLSSNLDYQRPLGIKWRINGGLKFENSDFRVDGMNDEPEKKSDFNLYTVYAGLKYDYNENWRVEGGLNYQYYAGNSTVGTLAPRVKVNYSRSGWNVWADYAKTVQYLALYPFFTIKSPIDIWYPLDQHSRPAECRQYSLGVDKEIYPSWYVYAALFLKDMAYLKDFAFSLQTDYSHLADRQIEGMGRAKGVELDVIFNREKIYLRANYTLSESDRQFEEINEGERFHPPYDMKHNFLFNGSYALTSRLMLNVLWTYTSGAYATFPVGVVVAQDINSSTATPVFVPVYRDRYNYKLPDNHRLDVSGDYLKDYRKYDLKISVGIYNVYNQQNPTFVYFEPETKDKYYTRFIPKSKVLLPFIPYVAVTWKW